MVEMKDDVIYRQMAIDGVLKLTYADGAYGYAYAKDLVDSLENLPSAQPEQAVKGCRNCKYGKYNDHWKTRFCYNPNECTEWNLWEPSAQPECLRLERILKKASIHRYGNDVRCTILDHALNRTFGYKFCPMCGARLILRIEKQKGRKNEL